MNTKQLQHFEGESVDDYKGIRIYASKGLHEKSYELIENLGIPKDSTILILGAGGGAFDQRLIDNGYTNITSIDLIKEDYHISGTNFFERNLNYDFSDLGEFDCIIALEIIEHLENQFHFIKNIKKCLNKKGHLILSTPNILSRYARIWSCFSNNIFYFSEENLKYSGHINIILPHILKFNLENNNLTIIKQSTNRELWKIMDKGSIKYFIYGLIMKILMFFIPGNNDEISIYVIKYIDSKK